MNLRQKRGKTELNQATESSDEDLVLNMRLWVQSGDREGEFYLLIEEFTTADSGHVLGRHLDSLYGLIACVSCVTQHWILRDT